ncbi:hypothetical protein LCGC14_1334730 [marine sediment metagenome]|uniref:Uncharacterized protein n=1 Tax=marine sediment metagenome TaxID=412755 RepID=A0A0F9MWD5_9ZZZZ|nr:hypothetical protein [Desulfobacterales bacterium]
MVWTKEYRSDYSKNYRMANKKKLSTYRKKYRLNNKERIQVQDKEYYVANIGKITAHRKLNGQKARDYCKAYTKLNSERLGLYKKEYRQNLSNAYVKSVLIVQGRRYGSNVENVTQELIDLKRGQLSMYREINKLKKEVRNGANRARN